MTDIYQEVTDRIVAALLIYGVCGREGGVPGVGVGQGGRLVRGVLGSLFGALWDASIGTGWWLYTAEVTWALGATVAINVTGLFSCANASIILPGIAGGVGPASTLLVVVVSPASDAATVLGIVRRRLSYW